MVITSSVKTMNHIEHFDQNSIEV